MSIKILVTLVFLAYVNAKPYGKDKEFEKDGNRFVRYCQPQTPCGWKIYNYVDYPEIELTNEYCECHPGQGCSYYKNRSNEGYIEYRCKY